MYNCTFHAFFFCSDRKPQKETLGDRLGAGNGTLMDIKGMVQTLLTPLATAVTQSIQSKAAESQAKKS